MQPPGGHAIYIDARAFLPHIPPAQFPGVALAGELYIEGGIRSVEIGTLMFGERDEMDRASGPMDLCVWPFRVAFTRRVHIDYVVEVILEVWRKRENICGYEIIEQAKFLRHFSAKLKPVQN